jgi:hypothetical protein
LSAAQGSYVLSGQDVAFILGGEIVAASVKNIFQSDTLEFFTTANSGAYTTAKRTEVQN